jgi:hypothetical protein
MIDYAQKNVDRNNLSDRITVVLSKTGEVLPSSVINGTMYVCAAK